MLPTSNLGAFSPFQSDNPLPSSPSRARPARWMPAASKPPAAAKRRQPIGLSTPLPSLSLSGNVRPSVRSVVKVADLASSSSVLRGTLPLSRCMILSPLYSVRSSRPSCNVGGPTRKCGFTALFAPVTTSSQVTLKLRHDIAIWDIHASACKITRMLKFA